MTGSVHDKYDDGKQKASEKQPLISTSRGHSYESISLSPDSDRPIEKGAKKIDQSYTETVKDEKLPLLGLSGHKVLQGHGKVEIKPVKEVAEKQFPGIQKPEHEKTLEEDIKKRSISNFEKNMDTILSCDQEGIKKLKVKNGLLIISKSKPSKKENEKALDLVAQTYRQSKGVWVQEAYGIVGFRDEQLTQAKELSNHLSKVYPEATKSSIQTIRTRPAEKQTLHPEVKMELESQQKKVQQNTTEYVSRFFKRTHPKPEEVEVGKQEVIAREERYNGNVKILLNSDRNAIEKLVVKNNKLEVSNEVPTEAQKKEVLELIQNTYRQALGKLIESEHGLKPKPAVLKQFNDLKTHLEKHYPESISGIEPEKQLKVITGSYRVRQTTAPSQLQEKKGEAEIQRQNRVSKLEQETLDSSKVEISSVNSPDLLSIKGGEKVAIKKKTADQGYGKITGEMLGLDSSKVEENKNEYAKIAGINETIATDLNILLRGRFNFPITMRDENTTLHAFVENKGTLHTQNPTLTPQAAQRFVLGQIAMRNTDCHTNNVLVGMDGSVIPIDFGRSLPANPQHSMGAMRGSYLNFPGLDEPFNEEDKRYFSQLDVEKTIIDLRNNLKAQHPEDFKNPILAPLIEANLQQLKANLYMIKLAIKEDLTPRQLLALNFPPLDLDMIEPIHLAFERQSRVSRKDFKASVDWVTYREILRDYTKGRGFESAWANAYNGKELNVFKFQKEINAEIAKVKGKSKDELYPKATQDIYHRAALDESKPT